MLYEEPFRGLQVARVRYLIVGALAVNLHGVPRMTADLDLRVDMEPDNLRTFIHTLDTLGYRPRDPVSPEAFLDPAIRSEWQTQKAMIVFTWLHPGRPYEEVDHFVENPIEFGPAYGRRVEVTVGDIRIPLASIFDLIALKRLSGREQDRSDIEALEQLQRLEEGTA